MSHSEDIQSVLAARRVDLPAPGPVPRELLDVDKQKRSCCETTCAPLRLVSIFTVSRQVMSEGRLTLEILGKFFGYVHKRMVTVLYFSRNYAER